MSKRKWGHAKKKKRPEGFDYVEPTLTALENELREVMNSTHQGKKKRETVWPIHQINNQRSRYVYDMYYKHKKISKELYSYLLKEKMADADLIAKWKKPGYENLCSTFVIDQRNFPFGSTAICRVPRQNLDPEESSFQEAHTGCRGCASGSAGYQNIFGNKYGQNLATIQIKREQEFLEEREYEDETHASGGTAENQELEECDHLDTGAVDGEGGDVNVGASKRLKTDDGLAGGKCEHTADS